MRPLEIILPPGYRSRSRRLTRRRCCFPVLLRPNHHAEKCRWQRMQFAVAIPGVSEHLLQLLECVSVTGRCCCQHNQAEARGQRWRNPVFIRYKLQQHGASAGFQRGLYPPQQLLAARRVKVMEKVDHECEIIVPAIGHVERAARDGVIAPRHSGLGGILAGHF